jgi:magnesium transporter
MRTLFDCAAKSFTEPTPDEIAKRVAEKRFGFWLDIQNPDEDDYNLLTEVFRFHPLTIEDVRHQNQRPKFEEFSGYEFIVLFSSDWEGEQLGVREHHLYLGDKFLITIHHEPEPGFKEVRERLEQGGEGEPSGPDLVTYLVLSTLVDQVFGVLEKIDDTADSVQDRALTRATPQTLSEITNLRHDVAVLRRHLGAERDLFQRLLTHALQNHDQETTLYYRDVYDHLVRQYEQADAVRDLLSGAMDIYLSTVSNRLNETMRALTAIASVFLPLSFLTGFFGMNFGWLVGHIGTAGAFAGGLMLMAASVVIQLALFRRRGWI